MERARGLWAGDGAAARLAVGMPSPRLVGTVCAAGIGVILAADVATPRDVTLGSLGVLPVLVARVAGGRRCGRILLALAIWSRVATAVLHGTTRTTAAIDVVAYLAAAILAGLVMRSRSDREEPPEVALTGTSVLRTAVAGVTGGAVRGTTGCLTTREREVAELAAQGYTAPEIGAMLFISDRTVESHLANIYPKLGVRSKRELVRALAGVR